ncbi:MAG TPA: AAA family ATPase [Candidatus Butyricimonas faecavium]|nr:AAA family ATPase [Candidatus Butyricimonas faecavium]
MESNPQLELAYDFLEYTGVNVFLTGKAGTGKTTFLRELKQRSPKRMIVVAPTGVAAINAGGVTIHSFFQLPFGPYVPGVTGSTGQGDKLQYTHKFNREKINIIKTIDLLVIDEISMVRADLLDAVDDMLRRYRSKNEPFGGVQLLLIGDLQQLAPVVKEDEWTLLKQHYASAFFFHSKALAATRYVMIELKHVYRQQDREFVNLLNRVDVSVLGMLNQRYIPDFKPLDEEGYITLTTHNHQAQRINDVKMAELSTKAYSFKAEVKDNFPTYSYPTEETLVLKQGAQVMFVKNDSLPEKRYYNGKIGEITAINDRSIEVVGKEDGLKIQVTPEEWTNTRYTLDEETREITETVEGTFKQYPLKTAWAITIHKSQGLTFERAIVDANAAFAHGQVYVALSRCKTFEGLVLSSPVTMRSLVSDGAINEFVREVEQKVPNKEELQQARQAYFRELLLEQFDYESIRWRLHYLYRVLDEQLRRLYPDWVERYRVAGTKCAEELLAVAERFQNQLERLMAEEENYEENSMIAERVRKGAEYFREHTMAILGNFLEETIPEIDNKEVRKLVEQNMERFCVEVNLKLETLKVIKNGFSVKDYLRAKAKALIDAPKVKIKAKRAGVEKVEVSSDVLHSKLYETLRNWRNKEAERLKLPVYTVLQQKALLGISNTLPTNSKELLAVPGIGKKIMERYGAVLLDMVDEYRLQQK